MFLLLKICLYIKSRKPFLNSSATICPSAEVSTPRAKHRLASTIFLRSFSDLEVTDCKKALGGNISRFGEKCLTAIAAGSITVRCRNRQLADLSTKQATRYPSLFQKILVTKHIVLAAINWHMYQRSKADKLLFKRAIICALFFFISCKVTPVDNWASTHVVVFSVQPSLLTKRRFHHCSHHVPCGLALPKRKKPANFPRSIARSTWENADP